MRSSNRFLHLALLGLTTSSLLTACAEDDTQGAPAAEVSEDGTQIVRGPLTPPSSAPPREIAIGYLRGRVGAAADELVAVSERVARGVTHLRFEQHVDGLRVHGAYAKAAVDSQGQLVLMINKLAPGNQRALGATLDAQGALDAALAKLGYPVTAPQPTGGSGNTTVFATPSGFYRAPSAERVVYVDDGGALREGFVVETWTGTDNQLDHTLVDGRSGRVVSIEDRTASDSYNVFRYYPGYTAPGMTEPVPQTVESGPAPLSPVPATLPATDRTPSPAGWLSDVTQSTTSIVGNNARAYLDTDNNNAPDTTGALAGSQVTDGNFLAALAGNDPKTETNRAVAVQNLFYLNNLTHDALYARGFDEAAGNFQATNFGRGGVGNDAVNAEAQDGGGTDNANFSTPADGSAPRMQMYLWNTSTPTAFVAVSGADYGMYASTFGGALTEQGLGGPLAVYDDGTGVASDGCEASRTSLTGKVAIVDRGTCDFAVKVLNAQNAGAVAVVIANNVDGNAYAPGGTSRKVRIPSGMVTRSDGATLKTAAATNQGATLRKNPVTTSVMLDGDLDSDIVFHEYGHGLTWRMIGSMNGFFAGAIGEGASDTLAFLLNGDDAIGEYSFSDIRGIRRYRYGQHPLTYIDWKGTSVHADGEIYAAAMWDLRELFRANGLTSDDLFALFVDGMNFTPAGPQPTQMRDGMLQAAEDRTLEKCLIWTAFARRGMGEGAGYKVAKGKIAIAEKFVVPAGACPTAPVLHATPWALK